MLLGLRTVIYHVSDIAQAKAWYQQATGVAPYFDEAFYVGFNIGGYELGLDPNPESKHTGVGGATAYWGVADVNAVFAHLVATGATPNAPVRDVGEGIRVASVLDPFGNEVGIIENPHFQLPDA